MSTTKKICSHEKNGMLPVDDDKAGIGYYFGHCLYCVMDCDNNCEEKNEYADIWPEIIMRSAMLTIHGYNDYNRGVRNVYFLSSKDENYDVSTFRKHYNIGQMMAKTHMSNNRIMKTISIKDRSTKARSMKTRSAKNTQKP